MNLNDPAEVRRKSWRGLVGVSVAFSLIHWMGMKPPPLLLLLCLGILVGTAVGVICPRVLNHQDPDPPWWVPVCQVLMMLVALGLWFWLWFFVY